MAYGSVSADTLVTSTSGGILGAGNASIMKNRIINGAMVIDQRNAGAASANTINGYFLDRWIVGQSTTGKIVAQQNAGSVTPPVGFSNYLGITSQSAFSVGTSELYYIQQGIEGFNTADLQFGTANAKTVTLSFWVRSSLTGTFGGTFYNNAVNRLYPYSYTISSANTWEQKTVTIAGDTTGTWVGSTNGAGAWVFFSLGAGSSLSGTAGAWVNGSGGAGPYSVTGATSVVGTSGATFYITGVQLEVGSSATGFEYRQYGTELNLCQRYFEKSYDINTAVGASTGVGNWDFIAGTSSGGNVLQTIRFTVSKRATGATITGYNDDGTVNQWKVGNSSGTVTTATPTFDLVSTSNFRAYVNSGQGNVLGRQIGNWTASSEL